VDRIIEDVWRFDTLAGISSLMRPHG